MEVDVGLVDAIDKKIDKLRKEFAILYKALKDKDKYGRYTPEMKKLQDKYAELSYHYYSLTETYPKKGIIKNEDVNTEFKPIDFKNTPEDIIKLEEELDKIRTKWTKAEEVNEQRKIQSSPEFQYFFKDELYVAPDFPQRKALLKSEAQFSYYIDLYKKLTGKIYRKPIKVNLNKERAQKSVNKDKIKARNLRDKSLGIVVEELTNVVKFKKDRSPKSKVQKDMLMIEPHKDYKIPMDKKTISVQIPTKVKKGLFEAMKNLVKPVEVAKPVGSPSPLFEGFYGTAENPFDQYGVHISQEQIDQNELFKEKIKQYRLNKPKTKADLKREEKAVKAVEKAIAKANKPKKEKKTDFDKLLAVETKDIAKQTKKLKKIAIKKAKVDDKAVAKAVAKANKPKKNIKTNQDKIDACCAKCHAKYEVKPVAEPVVEPVVPHFVGKTTTFQTINPLHLRSKSIKDFENSIKEVNDEIKAKRGRPSKEKVVVEKKPRGRPAKEKVVVEKKPRGRPRVEKVVVEKKPRGRPRVEKIEKVEVVPIKVVKQVVEIPTKLVGSIPPLSSLSSKEKNPKSTAKALIISKLIHYSHLKENKLNYREEILNMFIKAVKPDTFNKYDITGNNITDHLQPIANYVINNGHLQYEEVIEDLKNMILDYSNTDKETEMAEKYFRKIGASAKEEKVKEPRKTRVVSVKPVRVKPLKEKKKKVRVQLPEYINLDEIDEPESIPVQLDNKLKELMTQPKTEEVRNEIIEVRHAMQIVHNIIEETKDELIQGETKEEPSLDWIQLHTQLSEVFPQYVGVDAFWKLLDIVKKVIKLYPVLRSNDGDLEAFIKGKWIPYNADEVLDDFRNEFNADLEYDDMTEEYKLIDKMIDNLPVVHQGGSPLDEYYQTDYSRRRSKVRSFE